MAGDHAAKIGNILELICASHDVGYINSIMQNAKREHQAARLSDSHLSRVQNCCWRRLAILAGQRYEDTLTRRWHEVIAALEAVTGKIATRTRPMLERHGAQNAFERLVNRSVETDGFQKLIAAEMPDMTAEWIVLEFPDLFDQNTRAAAEKKLLSAGVLGRP